MFHLCLFCLCVDGVVVVVVAAAAAAVAIVSFSVSILKKMRLNTQHVIIFIDTLTIDSCPLLLSIKCLYVFWERLWYTRCQGC